MKRVFILSLFTLMIGTGAAFAQTFQSCAHKEQIREYVAMSDSLSRYFGTFKSTVPDQTWQNFTRAVENGEGEAAFTYLGRKGEVFKQTLNSIGYLVHGAYQKLAEAVSADTKVADADLKKQIERELNCYYSDPKENSFTNLVIASGRLAPPEIGTLGPCEIAMENCLSAASAAHSIGLNNCISITVGGGFFGWIGGLFAGTACLVNVESTYNNAKFSCFRNYINCTGH